jgi:hypothetical protein
MLIDSAPQQVRFTADMDEDFVQMSSRTGHRPHLLDTLGELLAELVTPPANGLITDHHAALQK